MKTLDIIKFAQTICKMDLNKEQEETLKHLEQKQAEIQTIRKNGYEQYAFYQNIVNLS